MTAQSANHQIGIFCNLQCRIMTAFLIAGIGVSLCIQKLCMRGSKAQCPQHTICIGIAAPCQRLDTGVFHNDFASRICLLHRIFCSRRIRIGLDAGHAHLNAQRIFFHGQCRISAE